MSTSRRVRTAGAICWCVPSHSLKAFFFVAGLFCVVRQVFCLGMHEKLSGNTMADIMAAGYSRVLVYEGEDTRNIRGYLQVGGRVCRKTVVVVVVDVVTSSLLLPLPPSFVAAGVSVGVCVAVL